MDTESDRNHIQRGSNRHKYDVVYAIIMTMKTIVVDTSVVISALIGEAGPSREVVRRCLLGHYEPLISNALFQECEAVSSRDRVRSLCPLGEDDIRELLNAYYSVCRWVRVYYLWRPNLLDEDDNFLIELAVAGNATHIVTNNVRDIAHSELVFSEIHVCNPEQFLGGR